MDENNYNITQEMLKDEIKGVVNKIGHFPTIKEMRLMNKYYLYTTIMKYGGMEKIRILFGYGLQKKPNGYWTDETIVDELKQIIEKCGHFPTQKDSLFGSRNDLKVAINRNGGANKFRKLLGYELFYRPDNFWTDETIIQELKVIIKNIGYFPSWTELESMNKGGILNAIGKHGGINKFRNLLGCKLIHKPKGYWNNETIKDELRILIEKLGRFPLYDEIASKNRYDLMGAIDNHGGISKFRLLMGYNLLQKPMGYWTEENVIKEIKILISTINHFPTADELILINKSDLLGGIIQNGGIVKFRQIFGYSSIHEKYITESHLYIVKRGKSTESIVKKILIDYCATNDLPPPQYNTKLAKGNIIEFVCNTNKTIGIDVTNTKLRKDYISKKWLKKSYHLYLDELWVVVFSDRFKDRDYTKWNQESPKNVKVMSIYDFLHELDYSINEYTKSKIDKYCSCTFHTKEDLKVNDRTKISIIKNRM